jgi:transposase
MNKNVKYDTETKQRAVRLYLDRRTAEPSESQAATERHVSGLLDINANSLRTWVKKNSIASGNNPAITDMKDEEIRKLRRDNAELRRANSILKAASAFFAAEIDRPSV